MRESENQEFKLWRWEQYVISGTESGRFYEWWTWTDWLDEYGSYAGIGYFWGRALREGDVLFLGPDKLYSEEEKFESFEEAFEYRDSLPPWDRTRCVDMGTGHKAYDTETGEWMTYDEMDKDTVAAIEAVWQRGPFYVHIMSDGSVKPPEYWQEYYKERDGQGPS